MNGAWTQDFLTAANGVSGYKSYFYSFPNSASGTITVTATFPAADASEMRIWELAGAATSSVVDATATTTSTGNPSMTLTTTAANSCIIATVNAFSGDWTPTAGTNFTLAGSEVQSGLAADEYWLDVGATGGKTVAMSLAGGTSGPWCTLAGVAYKVAAGATPRRPYVIGGGLGGPGCVIGS